MTPETTEIWRELAGLSQRFFSLDNQLEELRKQIQELRAALKEHQWDDA